MGASSLLVIFTVLALLTFATLSVASAMADQRLSSRTTENSSAWYAAQNQAEETLGNIDDALAQAYGTGSASAYYAAIPGLLPADCAWNGDAHTITFTKTISDSQNLSVVLSAVYPAAGEAYYRVDTWQAVSTGSWQPDDTLPVITLP